MEDAVDALKIAFSVFVFVLALSIVFAVASQAKQVSDIVVAHSDNTYFEEYVLPKEDKYGNIDTTGREVGIESIIPTLYQYSDGKTVIEIVEGTTNSAMLKELFNTEVERKYRDGEKNYTEKDSYEGYYTDINERYETKYDVLYKDGIIWMTSDKRDANLRVSAFVGGINQIINPDSSNPNKSVDYSSSGRTNLKNLKNTSFIEKFIERTDYSGSRIVYPDGSVIDLEKGTTKFYVTYTY